MCVCGWSWFQWVWLTLLAWAAVICRSVISHCLWSLRNCVSFTIVSCHTAHCLYLTHRKYNILCDDFLEEITIVLHHHCLLFLLNLGYVVQASYKGQLCKPIYHVLKIKTYFRETALAPSFLAISEPNLWSSTSSRGASPHPIWLCTARENSQVFQSPSGKTSGLEQMLQLCPVNNPEKEQVKEERVRHIFLFFFI